MTLTSGYRQQHGLPTLNNDPTPWVCTDGRRGNWTRDERVAEQRQHGHEISFRFDPRPEFGPVENPILVAFRTVNPSAKHWADVLRRRTIPIKVYKRQATDEQMNHALRVLGRLARYRRTNNIPDGDFR